MKTLLTAFLICLSCFANAQDLKQYFGQAVFHSDDKVLIKSVEEEIRNTENIWMVRIDPTNGNVLIFTTEISNWTTDDLSDLFGKYADKLGCLFVGVNRQDKIKTFPFKDCK